MGYGELIRSDAASIRLTMAIIGLCALVGGCSGTTYSGPGWSARVIDAETGAPIEGAIVVVRWPLERYSGSFAGWLFVTEAATDADGIFVLPAWGPIRSPVDSGRQTRMSPNVPELHIFKSEFDVDSEDCCGGLGYLDNGYGGGPNERPAWSDGQVFALRHRSSSIPVYIKWLEQTIPTNGPPCVYEKTPQIFAAAVNEDKRLRNTYGKGLRESTLSRFEEQAKFEKCRTTVLAIIERYLQ